MAQALESYDDAFPMREYDAAYPGPEERGLQLPSGPPPPVLFPDWAEAEQRLLDDLVHDGGAGNAEPSLIADVEVRLAPRRHAPRRHTPPPARRFLGVGVLAVGLLGLSSLPVLASLDRGAEDATPAAPSEPIASMSAETQAPAPQEEPFEVGGDGVWTPARRTTSTVAVSRPPGPGDAAAPAPVAPLAVAPPATVVSPFLGRWTGKAQGHPIILYVEPGELGNVVVTGEIYQDRAFRPLELSATVSPEGTLLLSSPAEALRSEARVSGGVLSGTWQMGEAGDDLAFRAERL